jgi:hypothetical protein
MIQPRGHFPRAYTRELLELLHVDVELQPLEALSPTDAFRAVDGRVFSAFPTGSEASGSASLAISTNSRALIRARPSKLRPRNTA